MCTRTIKRSNHLGLTAQGVVFLLAGAVMFAQPSIVDTGTIFPSDTESPGEVGLRLLRLACPESVVEGKDVKCTSACPPLTSFGKYADHFDWTLKGVTRGHFLSPSSVDAALWMEGCEPHSLNFGGTILLTNRGGKWSMVWYKAGVETSKCHKVPLPSGREILVCMGGTGAQGTNTVELYVEDLLHPAATLMAGGASFFSALDNTLSCGWNEGRADKPFEIVRAKIEKVEFEVSDGKGPEGVAVTSTFGKRTPTPDEAKACLVGRSIAPLAAKSYRLEFVFSGRDYKPAASSAAEARVFGQVR